MCGRYSFYDYDPDEVIDSYALVNGQLIKEYTPHYQIAPDTTLPVIRKHSPNHIAFMTWGITPKWERGKGKIAKKIINAKSETMFTNMFQHMAQSKRCLIPANGFFEWKKTAEGKTPYYIHLKERNLFTFAGIYDVWTDAEGKEQKQFAIITTTPNSMIAPIHTRMPVIMQREHEEAWLNPDETEKTRLLPLLTPYPSHEMDAYPVSRAVNNPRNDTPAVIQPL